ncbi:unnamed protein product [Phaedon cochleariae]|uniref:Uncharacterized protein n=1 Tax=Phaedon cochleariae TaxID=80249 RepID=A0A9N9SDC4_PHACE|nr:unnamed protein product [Phaedon cochleariae]
MNVTASINAKRPSHQARSLEQLKSKYENLKTKLRKCAASYQKHLKGTGGGPSNEPDWDPVIEAVLRIINEKPVIGFQNSFDSDYIDNASDLINDIEVENHDVTEEFYLVMDPAEVENQITNTVEDFDTVEDIITVPKMLNQKTDVELINNQHQDAELEISSNSNDWSKYTPRKLKTPINKKLRQKTPISSALQNAKQEYYVKRTALLEK